MSTDNQAASASKVAYWAGWVLSVLPALMLTMSGVMKLAPPPTAAEGFKHLGWEMNVAVGLAVVELGSMLLYLIPRTAVLGAILLTGYLGGAIATHVRISEYSAIVMPVLLGVMIWLGLYLRDVRLRALVPFRS